MRRVARPCRLWTRCACGCSARRACSPSSSRAWASSRRPSGPRRGKGSTTPRRRFRAALEARREQLDRRALDAELARGAIDVTLPGRGQEHGQPASGDARALAHRAASSCRRDSRSRPGPEVEDDFHNFEALNIPRQSSGACDARYVLFSGRPAVAHAHLARADPRHARAQAADGADRPGPRVPQRLGHDAHARCSIRSRASWSART